MLITGVGVAASHRDSAWWWWSCGRVGVGAGRAFGPPVGFGRLAAVAELAGVGALDSVWLVMLSAGLLGVAGLAVWLSVLAGAW